MAGAARARRGGGAVLVALVLATALPAAAMAGEAIPPVHLSGETIAGVTVDLDGDGAREVLVLGAEEGPGSTALDIWTHGAGGWDRIGHEVLPDAAQRADVGLVVLRGEHRERPFVISRRWTVDPGSCCLLVGEVLFDGATPQLAWTELEFGADAVHVLDVDGDGIDELLTFVGDAGPRGDRPEVALRLLRPSTPGRLVVVPILVPPQVQPAYPTFIGETDGIPGDEILVLSSSGTTLHRIVIAADDGVEVERAWDPWARPRNRGPWISQAVDGQLLAVSIDEVALARWPRGGEPAHVAHHPVEPFPWVHVLGQGPGARILVVRADQFGQRRTPSLTVLDSSLNETARVDASPVAEQLHALARGGGTLSHRVGSWLPYVGPLPGGLQDGRDAFLMAGVLVTLDATGAIETAPASPLSGRHPLGVAGPEGSWMLLATGWAGSRVEATLRAADASGVATLLVPMSDVLPADPDADGVAVAIEGGVIVDHRGVSRLLTSEKGATATISGPTGSVVIGAVDATVVAAMEVGGDPVAVDLAPRRASEANQEFAATIVVISPTGRPSVVEWPVEIRRTPPDLDLEARTTLFSFEATLEGRVTPPATVEVDGRTAVIDRDGRFSMSVGAGVWPRGIEVEARDPFGNVQRGRIDVVGLVDYRGLPWLPITVISTLLIGAVLSVRLPARGQRDLLDDEAGSLEEIGGDPG